MGKGQPLQNCSFFSLLLSFSFKGCQVNVNFISYHVNDVMSHTPHTQTQTRTVKKSRTAMGIGLVLGSIKCVSQQGRK